MIERLIENWLNRTTERAFTVPFCQLLLAQGYKILWISPHNLNEAGKDVIAEKDGELSCFQLKDETINLPFFLQIEPELRELLTHPIKHPSIDPNRVYKSYLVTTKTVNDPVPSRITEKNQVNWGLQKEAKLEYWDRGYLLPLFVESYGAFFPKDPIAFREDLDNFFRLFFSDGKSMLPKKDICSFFESFLSLYSEKVPSKNESATSISALVLLTSYILTPWANASNYIAQIEGWVSLQSYIYAAVEKYNLPKKFWKDAIGIIDFQIDSLFEGFIEELKQRKHLVEGDWFTEAAVYGAKAAIVLGYLSAYIFRLIVSGKEVGQNLLQLADRYFRRYLFLQRLYGEAYLPLMIYSTILTRLLKMEKEYVGLTHTLLTGLVDKKYIAEPLGLPSPYFEYEETLEICHGYKTDTGETFKGQSFFLRSLVEFAVRADMKQMLQVYWRKVSHIQNSEFVPKDKWESFVYRAKNGTNQERFLDQSQSWTSLHQCAISTDYSELPVTLVNDKKFALLFGLVFPHRASPSFFRSMDNSISSSCPSGFTFSPSEVLPETK